MLTGIPMKQYKMCKRISDSSSGPKFETKIVKKEVIEEKLVKVPDGKGGITEQIKKVKVIKDVEEKFEIPSLIDDQECLWVDERATKDKESDGYTYTGKTRMTYAPPAWVADKGEGYILLLDDHNRGDLRFLQSLMEVLDRQENISWKLPKDWHIILTGNPEDGDYFVQSQDDAQKTRYLSFQVKFDKDDWAKWAENEGVDGRCINFLLSHPEVVTKNTNPRSIVNFFNSISSIPDFDKRLDLVSNLGEASVGPEFTALFVSFINNRLDKLIQPDEILTIKDDEICGKKLLACIGKDETYRPDIASVINTRLINYSTKYAESNPIDKKLVDRFIYLCTEPILGDDLKYVLVKKLICANKQKFQKVLVDQRVVEMSLK